ncbi:hypothetical protein [Streptomyces iconiensis]|uniref:Uncharacterized protein n=1 Tax=Streptomyces iconiensis TaxID=1384038 RepID=A0ABT7A7D1_9ACTN|nr:hypothetical protein [Streptomyces iconiensis]MDJ1137250.1 hypothetical protein [Streptomyces iconiensis]
MRGRVTAAFSALAAAGVLILAGPQSAQAATGELVINGQRYQNPSGCYPVPGQASIENHTDARITLYMDAGCAGSLAGTINAGGGATLAPVYGVYVP